MGIRHISPLDQLLSLQPPLPWQKSRFHPSGDELVVLIHGLWRSPWAMHNIARSLQSKGYSTLNFAHPSFRLPLEGLVDHLETSIAPYRANFTRIHFVTHSLGGVILRSWLNTTSLENLDKLVMLAPPLRGSQIVDHFCHSWLRHLLGPAGSFLSTEHMAAINTPLPTSLQAAIIMGDKSSVPFFRSLLDSDNDGIVSVASGQLAGKVQYQTIHADHTMFPSHPQALELISTFLKSGQLNPTSTAQSALT